MGGHGGRRACDGPHCVQWGGAQVVLICFGPVGVGVSVHLVLKWGLGVSGLGIIFSRVCVSESAPVRVTALHQMRLLPSPRLGLACRFFWYRLSQGTVFHWVSASFGDQRKGLSVPRALRFLPRCLLDPAWFCTCRLHLSLGGRFLPGLRSRSRLFSLPGGDQCGAVSWRPFLLYVWLWPTARTPGCLCRLSHLCGDPVSPFQQCSWIPSVLVSLWASVS